jgi:8-oxo-dGTP diphosphatase
MPLTDTVKFLQKAAIIHEGKVVIVKRSEHSASRPGGWDLPGGNAEWPTHKQPTADVHREDIAREIREETGWVFDGSIFTNENLVHFTTYFEPAKTQYAFICGWHVTAPPGFDPATIQLSDEHSDFKWISLSELDSYDFIEPAGAFIKTIIKNALQRK